MLTNNPIEDQTFLTFVGAESAKKQNKTKKLCMCISYVLGK